MSPTGRGMAEAGRRRFRAFEGGAAAPPEPNTETEVESDASCTIAAPSPDLTGDPGERTMDCVAFAFRRGKRRVTVLTFAEVGTGQIARKWYELPEPLVQSCKFWRDVLLALGAPVRSDERVDLRAAFVGKRFRVRVGYRKTPGAKGGGKARDELARQRKDGGDFLRVHDLLERLA